MSILIDPRVCNASFRVARATAIQRADDVCTMYSYYLKSTLLKKQQKQKIPSLISSMRLVLLNFISALLSPNENNLVTFIYLYSNAEVKPQCNSSKQQCNMLCSHGYLDKRVIHLKSKKTHYISLISSPATFRSQNSVSAKVQHYSPQNLTTCQLDSYHLKQQPEHRASANSHPGSGATVIS